MQRKPIAAAEKTFDELLDGIDPEGISSSAGPRMAAGRGSRPHSGHGKPSLGVGISFGAVAAELAAHAAEMTTGAWNSRPITVRA
jgi:hypothetical protein